MKTKLLVPVALAFFAATAPAAFAHTHVRTTSIADNAALTAPPADFTVAFTEPAAIANVTLATGAGAPAPLNYQPPAGFAASYQIPLPHLDAGAYTLAWRMIARDGHVMNGTVHFTIHAP
ncbi:MAG TPA: copper resistance CopC family protein [Caulobacterales bacterium]|nr:copper resistance CopC family protein [Caulobacterales bacterium]